MFSNLCKINNIYIIKCSMINLKCTELIVIKNNYIIYTIKMKQ